VRFESQPSFATVICWGQSHFTEHIVLPVLQVLQQLPEGLAIAVLAAAPADLERQLSILHPSLHQLAVNAAFPSIRRHKSLILDFNSLGTLPTTAHAVLHALNTAASAPPTLQLNHIPMHNNNALLQLISSACTSVSDLRLNFGSKESQPDLEWQPVPQWQPLRQWQPLPQWQPVMQLFQSLSCSKALSSLQLSFCDYPEHLYDMDSLLGTLPGLKVLTLAFDPPAGRMNSAGFIPSKSFFTSLSYLTLLSIGPGFH
jgi:hypothetical protein